MNATIKIQRVIERVSKARLSSADVLNAVHKQLYQRLVSEEDREVLLITIQTAIIQFEVASGLLNFLLTTPVNCFARKVILKGLIHIAFEYSITLKDHHIKALMDLCDSKGYNSQKENLSRVTRKYRKAIKQLDKFRELRKKTTGHYDPDIATQVSLIESINEHEYVNVMIQFLSFIGDILDPLSEIRRKIYLKYISG
jgi:hypothetical protein